MADLVTLRTRLDAYVDRSDADYLAQRNYFINLAIRQIAREVGIESNVVELVATQAVSAGTDAFAMPAALRNTTETHLVIRDAGGIGSPMREIPVKFLTQAFYDSEDFTLPNGDVSSSGYVDYLNDAAQGRPRHYAIGTLSGARRVHIRPVPDSSYSIEIRGVRYTVDLVADADENYVSLEAEDAVLYSAISEAWSFLEDEGRAGVWRNKAAPLVMKFKNYRTSEATNALGKLQMGTWAAGGVIEDNGGTWNAD